MCFNCRQIKIFSFQNLSQRWNFREKYLRKYFIGKRSVYSIFFSVKNLICRFFYCGVAHFLHSVAWISLFVQNLWVAAWNRKLYMKQECYPWVTTAVELQSYKIAIAKWLSLLKKCSDKSIDKKIEKSLISGQKYISRFSSFLAFIIYPKYC